MILSPNEIAWCAAKVGWRGDDVAIAVAVALAESGGDTLALGYVKGTSSKPASGNFDHGLWQISSLWHGADLMLRGAAWRDPLVNAGLAFDVWNAKQSWSPWSTFNGGQYKALMPFGVKAALYPWAPPVYEPQPPVIHMTGTVNLTTA